MESYINFDRIYKDFRKVRFESDKGGQAHGQYIAPNEHFGHLYKGCVQNRPIGGIIGVGTWRMFDRLAHGNYPFLIMFDYDYGVVAFNRLFIKIIKKARDRWEFLSILFTGGIKKGHIDLAKRLRWSSIHFVKQLLQDHPGSIDITKYFGQSLGRLLKEKSNERVNGWKRLGLHLGWNNFSEKMKDHILGLLIKNDLYSTHKQAVLSIKNGFDLVQLISKSRYFLTEPWGSTVNSAGFRLSLEGSHRHKIFGETFVGSDQMYQRVRKKVIDGRVKVVVGDLTGDRSMRSIAAVLKSRGYHVSAVDISNVPDYLYRNDRKKMIENITRLPLTFGARIFFTTNRYDGRYNSIFMNDGWLYGAALAQDASKMIDYWKDRSKGYNPEFMIKRPYVKLQTLLSRRKINLQPYPRSLCRN